MAAMAWRDGEQWRRPTAFGMTALVVLAGFGRAFGGGPRPGAGMLILLVLGAVVALVLLLMIELAAWVRGVAVAALLCATISCAIRADIYRGSGGTAPSHGTRADGSLADSGDRTTDRDGERGGGAPTGAAVALDGDDRASEVSRALTGHIAEGAAGASAWRIEGDLADGDGAPIAVTLNWRIAGRGDRTDCGTLAVHATSVAELDAALAAAFTQAVSGSIRHDRPACV